MYYYSPLYFAVIPTQVLVTKPDFYNEETRKNLFCTLSELISLNVVPIINTNDAVSPPMYIHDDSVVPGTGKKVRKKITNNPPAVGQKEYSIKKCVVGSKFCDFTLSSSSLMARIWPMYF